MSRDESSVAGPWLAELLLVPGLDGTGRLFAPLLESLPPTLVPRVIPYPSEAVSDEEIADYVASRLPPDRPFALLGESYGGPIAIRVAARRPAGLQAVALVATFLRRPCPPIPFLGAALRASVIRTVLRPSFLRAAILGGATRVLVEDALNVLRSLDPCVLAERSRSALRVDVREPFRSLDCPLLHLRGARDRLIPAARAAEMKALRPELEEAVLDAPHLVLQTRPVESAAILRKFLLA